MALTGAAFLALWNDIDDAREAEYDLWHTVEHVPQRVGLPGFISGRRYRAAGGAPHYFTLYDVTAPAVFESRHYLALINEPTPWSRSMRPSFRNVVRAVCRTQRSAGQGVGGALQCVRIAAADRPSEDAAAAGALIDACAALEGVTAVHFGERIETTAAIFDNWQTGPMPAYVLLLEAASERALQLHATTIARLLDEHYGCGRIMFSELYDLCFTI
ncbi:MAG TPA: hypothetical protein VFE79_00040 [Paraburkholderia sp.]|jgi:hypothetical protein|nr:hypothetical protein [Paraburkholderia sp.]